MSHSSTPPPEPPPITVVLDQLARGESGAGERLIALAYDELKSLARRKLARLQPGQTLQATALVHEAWLKLGGDATTWNSRAHFFGAAARAMRNVLVDQARRKGRQKRDGGQQPAELRTDLAVDDGPTLEMLALDEALTALEQSHPRPAQVVMYRYFAGVELDDVARMLDVSARTVRREWLFARTWLRRALRERD